MGNFGDGKGRESLKGGPAVEPLAHERSSVFSEFPHFRGRGRGAPVEIDVGADDEESSARPGRPSGPRFGSHELACVAAQASALAQGGGGYKRIETLGGELGVRAEAGDWAVDPQPRGVLPECRPRQGHQGKLRSRHMLGRRRRAPAGGGEDSQRTESESRSPAQATPYGSLAYQRPSLPCLP